MQITKTINITRYNNNRKLYAPSGEISDKGTYVNLKDLALEIKKGNAIIVRDEDNIDITNYVLKQLLSTVEVSTDSLLKLIRS